MKLRQALFTAVALFLVNLSVVGQTEPAVPAPTPKPKSELVTTKTKVSAKEYDQLLSKLKSGDMSIDFARLRLAFTETKNHSPYGGSDLRAKMETAFDEKNYKDCLKAANEMLDKNYVDLHGHFYAMLSNRDLGNEKDAAKHRAILDKLLEAIQQNDGLSAKTAMISIGIAEQYFIMSYMGYRRQSKGLVQEGDSMFDVHTAYDEENDSTRKFFFNIDKVFGRF
jgi:methionine synthase I (cobalamin-dependent)